jgi:hypothetical protein
LWLQWFGWSRCRKCGRRWTTVLKPIGWRWRVIWRWMDKQYQFNFKFRCSGRAVVLIQTVYKTVLGYPGIWIRRQNRIQLIISDRILHTTTPKYFLENVNLFYRKNLFFCFKITKCITYL